MFLNIDLCRPLRQDRGYEEVLQRLAESFYPRCPIYTERYMGLPQQNADGYQNSSAVEAAERIHGRLLLIHGTKDDNVHLANTLQLAYALQKAGKPFEMMVYPKSRHGVGNSRQALHLRQLMTQFLLENL